ncbi:Ig-like domain-containing protein [Lysinibacillus xylanilyticus]|uniref:Ig-like domain-containing protein n=1 Tax=Lysinibacillus xylanilyticus TaxID=582475 RepID=UPI002E1A4E03|nr:Ig-like domain-containing protein [Lysinibacillus xylanilyticus]
MKKYFSILILAISMFSLSLFTNNSIEVNAASMGEHLPQPEEGWKRYDNTNPAIKYEGSWRHVTSTSPRYNNTESHSNVVNSSIEFYFVGTDLRIINTMTNNRDSINYITIDGEKENYSDYSNNPLGDNYIVTYEKLNLENKLHHVKIEKKENSNTTYLVLDAIDVDGTLLSENEIPSGESISLDKNNLELFEGGSEKLSATVTPDTAKVIWSSSDKSIATVDQDGNVTAVREGKAIITAKIENTDIEATSTVIVKKLSNESSNAILSITLVNGITKEYDVTNNVLNDYLKWFESAQGTSTFKFSKTISPYKKVTEYIVHDKIASFEVREY